MTDTTQNGAAEAATEPSGASILDTFDLPPSPSHPAEVDAAADAPEEESKDEDADVEQAAEADDSATSDASKDVPDAATAEAVNEEGNDDAAKPKDTPNQYAASDALTRLRDGTEVTIAELKKRADGEAIRERETQLESAQQRVKQQSEDYLAAINQAMGFIEARLPPMPDPQLLQQDPIGYMQQKEVRERAISEYHALEQARQQQVAQQQAEQADLIAKREQAERERAREAVPELANPATAKPFIERLKAAPSHYPNMPKDAPDFISEAWQIEVLRDAIAYRELQAQKAKVVEKVKDVPPVQPAGRRVSNNERRDQSLRDDLAKLKQSGDRALGEDILSRFA